MAWLQIRGFFYRRAFRWAFAFITFAALIWIGDDRHLVKFAFWHCDIGAKLREAFTPNRVATFALVDHNGSLMKLANGFLTNGSVALSDPLVATVGLILDNILALYQIHGFGFMLALFFRWANAVVTLAASRLINDGDRFVLLTNWQLLDGALGWVALTNRVIATRTFSNGLQDFVRSAFGRSGASA